MPLDRVINFSAGPSQLPLEVLQQAQAELLNFNNQGGSVMEISHRSAAFGKLVEEAEQDLRDLMHIPSNYKVIFMHGGGTGQFSAIPLNLCSTETCTADYMVTGAWSKKSADEAGNYCQVNKVFPATKKFICIPDRKDWKLSSDACYVYYCDNETVHGVEYPTVPDVGNALLVCDMSSNILTRPVDVTKFGLIYAGAQKNLGIAGVTVVIVREDLVGKARKVCPSVLDYKINSDNKSLYNTPATFSLYITGLVLKWLKKNGGPEAMAENCRKKSTAIYSLIDSSNGFYHSAVDPKCRSRVTIPFRIGGPEGNDSLEKKFLDEAQKQGMITLKGHRSVGGIRASLFNSKTLEETQKLVNFMKDFQQRNQE